MTFPIDPTLETRASDATIAKLASFVTFQAARQRNQLFRLGDSGLRFGEVARSVPSPSRDAARTVHCGVPVFIGDD